MRNAAIDTMPQEARTGHNLLSVAAAALAAEEQIDATSDKVIEGRNLDAWAAMMERLIRLPAASLAEVCAKAEAARETFTGDSFENRLATSIINDIRRVASATTSAA